MSVTVGIDLAADPKNTAIVAVSWDPGRAVVDLLHPHAVDDLVLHWMHHSDGAIGIDCPFGWPINFVALVSQHASGKVEIPEQLVTGWRRDYVLRDTDRYVHAALGLTPLSVAADRIAHVAIRLAALMSRLGPEIHAPLDGSGALAEVYPAAALKVWGLPHLRYKGSVNERGRHALVDQLLAAAPWLELGPHQESVRASDHALDALLCALVARAKQTGRTAPPLNQALARKEGWIHVPTCQLADLT